MFTVEQIWVNHMHIFIFLSSLPNLRDCRDNRTKKVAKIPTRHQCKTILALSRSCNGLFYRYTRLRSSLRSNWILSSWMEMIICLELF